MAHHEGLEPSSIHLNRMALRPFELMVNRCGVPSSATVTHCRYICEVLFLTEAFGAFWAENAPLVLAPRAGLEPATSWLTARRSAIELSRNGPYWVIHPLTPTRRANSSTNLIPTLRFIDWPVFKAYSRIIFYLLLLRDVWDSNP